MSMATLTILGMYKYKDGLFNQMNLPNGINKSDVINQILIDSSGFEVLYSDFDFMQDAIGLWSNSWYRTFEKWVKALSIKYAPLENYDRIEEWSDSDNSSTVKSSNENRNLRNSVNSNRNLNTLTRNTGTDLTIHNVSPFDTNAYASDSEDIVNLNNQSNVSDTGSTSTVGNDLGTVDTKDNGTSKSDRTHKGRIHGNIGVTTSQQMLREELNVARFNLVKKISDVFVKEFCIILY